MIRTIALAALAAALFADPAAGQSPYVGARLGASFATFGGPAVGDMDDRRDGLAAGLVGGWRLTDWLAVQSEVTWIGKGGRGTLQGFEEPISTDLELAYLQLPLLVRLAVPTPLPVRPVFLAGAAVAFETRCKVRSEPGQLVLAADCDAPEFRERRTTADWSALVGAGLEHDAGRFTIGVDARYDLGLVRVTDIAELENRAAVFTAQLLVPLGR